MKIISFEDTLQYPSRLFSGENKTRGPWATIRSRDKNDYYISANTMQLLPELPQQLGHKFDHTIKRLTVILVSPFEQT